MSSLPLYAHDDTLAISTQLPRKDIEDISNKKTPKGPPFSFEKYLLSGKKQSMSGVSRIDTGRQVWPSLFLVLDPLIESSVFGITVDRSIDQRERVGG